MGREEGKSRWGESQVFVMLPVWHILGRAFVWLLQALDWFLEHPQATINSFKNKVVALTFKYISNSIQGAQCSFTTY